jgi:hypothetical protein
LAQVYMNVRMHVCACMHGWMVGRICFHVWILEVPFMFGYLNWIAINTYF